MKQKTACTLSAVLMLSQSTLASVPGKTLADCQAFAARFANTCPDATAVDLATHQGRQVSCTGSDLRCPNTEGLADYSAESPCSWSQKLCVTCRENSDGEKAYIRVQSNGLPSQCQSSLQSSIVAMQHDWETVFQPDMVGLLNYNTQDVDSEEKTDALLCSSAATKSSTMHANSEYRYLGNSQAGGQASLEQVSGIDFSGVYLFQVPSGVNTSVLLDRTTTTSGNRDGLLGLAKDGHLMIGPKDDGTDGQGWSCQDHDICNGAFIDGQYVYLSSATFPYQAGCWGPAPAQLFAATCTSNSCSLAQRKYQCTEVAKGTWTADDTCMTLTEECPYGCAFDGACATLEAADSCFEPDPMGKLLGIMAGIVGLTTLTILLLVRCCCYRKQAGSDDDDVFRLQQ